MSDQAGDSDREYFSCNTLPTVCHYGMPAHPARCLTYCHDRRLRPHIGGRYRFIHRELLDHFAEMEN
jgi:hypothetical protein